MNVKVWDWKCGSGSVEVEVWECGKCGKCDTSEGGENERRGEVEESCEDECGWV